MVDLPTPTRWTLLAATKAYMPCPCQLAGHRRARARKFSPPPARPFPRSCTAPPRIEVHFAPRAQVIVADSGRLAAAGARC